jgi:RecA/RadA recombinase
MIKVWRNNRFIEVVGGAGSGKTWLAMEQARQWGEAGLSVAFLTYTKGVAEMVKKMFETQPEKQQPTFIGTFHALGYHWGVLPDPERTADPDYWTYELPPQYVDVANEMQPGEKFDAVIIDEAQDFSDGWWDVVLASVKDPQGYRLAIFRDDGQQVFEDRSGRPDLPFAVFDLDSNLRNGRRVVEAFAPLSKRKMEIGGGEGLPTRIVLTGEDNIIPAADDVVADLVDREGWLPEHVALLTTKGRHSEHALRQDADKDAYWQGLWATDDIFYGTVAGFKGLERPGVVIAVNGFHDHADTKDVLYTAISRAIELAVLVGTEAELTEVLGSKHLGKLMRRQEASASGGSYGERRYNAAGLPTPPLDRRPVS